MTNICSVDACDMVINARGWCKKHYTRWIKTGSTERKWSCNTCNAELDHSSKRYCGPECKPKRGNARLCTITGCSLRVTARDMCSTHYGRWKKNGTTEWPCRGCGAPLKSGLIKYCGDDCKPRCSVAECTNPIYSSQGWCASHDRQWRKNGEVRPFRYKWAAAGGVCIVCERPVPPESKRRKCCSAACQQRLSHHDGARAKTASCRGCGAEISLTERLSDGKLRRSDVQWCDSCLDQPTRRRMYRYGVTPEQYREACAKGCEICGRGDIELHIDHDHDCCPGGYTCGQCVRGFLCGSCNRAVGLLNENADTALSAAMYLVAKDDVLRSASDNFGGVPSRS